MMPLKIFYVFSNFIIVDVYKVILSPVGCHVLFVIELFLLNFVRP